jgi:hypothetical protein
MARAGLTPGVVVAQAAVLADDIGLERLTLAEVAKLLSVRLPSHIDRMEGLRRDLSLLALRELGQRLGAAASGKSGRDALHATADAYRSYALQFPGRYAATLKASPTDDVEYQDAAAAVLHVVASVVNGYGLEGDEAIHAIRGLRATLHGWADLEKSGAFEMPQDLEVGYRQLIDRFDASLKAVRQ